MSYEQDYIKRLFKKLGDVLARALGLAKSGNHDESLQVLEQGVSAELGLPLPLLLKLDAKSAVALLGQAKAGAFAEVLRTRSLLLELAGRSEAARASTTQADLVAALLSTDDAGS